jgi:hypothetical protein
LFLRKAATRTVSRKPFLSVSCTRFIKKGPECWQYPNLKKQKQK